MESPISTMIGSIINNKYRIEEELGRGGMGIVYRAYDTLLNRTVALKIMNPELVQRQNLLQRFLGEAQILVKLSHPHIVKVYDLQVMAPGFFIVMEYVEGLTLTEKIKPSARIPYQEALPIFKQTLQAIAYAHQAGVLHRDIKPSNIMLTPNNGVKVMDFGLAKNPQEVDLTQSQDVFGTPAYMSPEQIKGLKKADRRSDIYALGMTFYEILTGRWPFPAQENFFTLIQVIINDEFPSPTRFNPTVPKALARIVMKALEKEPEQRFQTAEEMLAAIVQLEREPITLQPSTVPAPVPPPNGSKIRVWQILVAAALLLVVALGVYKFLGNSSLPSQSALPRLTHSPLMMELAGITETSTLQQKLVEYRRAMQIAVGKEDDFESLEGCYVFVCDEQRVLGVFQLKGNIYYAVNSITSYADLPKQFSGKMAIWVQDYRVNLDLPQKNGKLSVLARPFGSIYINGDIKRKDTNTRYTTDLPVGPQRVRVVHPILGLWEKTVNIEADKTHEIQIDFNKKVKLVVTSFDESRTTSLWGEIYVDGKPTGYTTPSQLTLRVGKHTIEVRREGYILVGKPITISLEEDVNEPLVFRLSKVK